MNRGQRIGDLIKEKVSLILRKKVADPRIGFVSITDVKMPQDLKSAKIFVSIYGSERDKKETMKGLSSARGFIQGELGRSLELRYVPIINFEEDKSIERGSRVLVIMSKLEKEASECQRLSKSKRRESKK